MYNPKSLKADEFISHQEIIDTLDFAERNKSNYKLIIFVINSMRRQFFRTI